MPSPRHSYDPARDKPAASGGGGARPGRAPAAPAAPPDHDPLDEILSLAEAARLCGLNAHTLTQQAERGKLHARKLGHTWVTTRYWLAEYLAHHARRKPNPES